MLYKDKQSAASTFSCPNVDLIVIFIGQIPCQTQAGISKKRHKHSPRLGREKCMAMSLWLPHLVCSLGSQLSQHRPASVAQGRH